jgi:hypothetical protein
MSALLAGCVWGRTTPQHCAAYQLNSASDALEREAEARGIRSVELSHALCSSRLERLEGLQTSHAEVGWCADIREQVPATAAAVRAAAGVHCAEAIRRSVAYAHWSAVVGDRFIFAAPRYEHVGPLSPEPLPEKR